MCFKPFVTLLILINSRVLRVTSSLSKKKLSQIFSWQCGFTFDIDKAQWLDGPYVVFGHAGVGAGVVFAHSLYHQLTVAIHMIVVS